MHFVIPNLAEFRDTALLSSSVKQHRSPFSGP